MTRLLLWGTIGARVLGGGLFLLVDPLTAYLLNGFLDAIDGSLYKHVVKLDPTRAQVIDKALDLWFYCIAYAALPLLPPSSMNFLTATFILRLVGQLVFFATKDRRVLLFFPNFFEVTFLFVFILKGIDGNFAEYLPLLGVLYVGKIVHEYVLHHKEITIFDHLLVPGMQLVRRKHHARRANKRR